MIEITKREAIYLRKVIPNVHITRTTHKWYAEEIKSVLTQLPGNVEARPRYANSIAPSALFPTSKSEVQNGRIQKEG